jgi:LacI family transcriptional regulator
MSHESRNKPAGIKEIAKALGISIGTVDRALHNRPGVSPKTRDLVLKIAEKLRYTPNIAARSLKLNRHLKIGIFLPEHISSFFDPLRKGIRAAAETESGAAVDLMFISYPRLGEGDVEAMEKANWQQFDGIIIAPGNPANLAKISGRAEKIKKPIVFVATDAPRLHRIASIAVDASVSGSVAADLLGRLIQTPGTVATVTGDLRVQDHSDKLRGFAASLATLSSHLALLPAIESHESPQDAYAATIKLLKYHSNLAGMYISTANSLPVIRAIEEQGRLGQTLIITTDLFPELISLIEDGHVAASLYQRPFTQGRLAFEMLSIYLNTGPIPQPLTRLAPHIILRSNLSLFLGTMTEAEQFTSLS